MAALGFVLTCLVAVLAGATVRFPQDRAFTTPWPWLDSAWWPVLGTLGLGAAVVSALAWRRLAGPEARGAFLRLWIFFPALLLSGWTLLSPTLQAPRDRWILGALLLTLAAMFARDLLAHRALGLSRAQFGPALRWLAAPTLLALAALFLLREPRPEDEISTPLALALVSYPLYALVQILVFLALLARGLARMGLSPPAVVATTAVVFALVHWPNPVVMGASLVGMVGWSLVYVRHPNLLAIAISMGVTAGAVAQWAPQERTHHMRVGPNYVITRQRHRDEAAWERLVTAHSDEAYYARAGGTLEGYVAALYRDLVGRAATFHEIRQWVRVLQEEYRAYVVRQFHNSPEYLEQNPHLPLLPLPEIDFLRRDFVPPQEGFEHYHRLVSRSFYAASGGNFHTWLREVYRVVLGREADEAGLLSWSPSPPAEQRRRVAEEFLHLARDGEVPTDGGS